MTTQASTVRELPDALRGAEEFGARLAGRRPAVFLDYDGVLTPIVDRPEDAVMSDDMREAVQARRSAAWCAWSAVATDPSCSS